MTLNTDSNITLSVFFIVGDYEITLICRQRERFPQINFVRFKKMYYLCKCMRVVGVTFPKIVGL